MQRSTAKRRVATAAPQAAIVLQAPGGRDDRTRFGFALMVFMRVTAAIWIGQGLLQWASVLTTGPDGLSPFAALAPAAMVAAVFFAVVDFIASVGLWLAAPWGGVIWLVAVGAQILVLVVMPGYFEHPLATGLVDVALMAAYLALVWFAAQVAEGEA
ncbi:DUF6163 family protein [Lichenibacterium ramalinae]|uniref:DoxX family protein n=1 Tax=Lichenibacterium ramalinae TaxID=2316527 RepID=A0A4Q2RDQ0_9HYPH|nr:DUF6163 family protein [Lichenibacterium ramalinae]RYB03391.1 hypothetical protein D3272_16640 [Lichenibacterium ramalinae]